MDDDDGWTERKNSQPFSIRHQTADAADSADSADSAENTTSRDQILRCRSDPVLARLPAYLVVKSVLQYAIERSEHLFSHMSRCSARNAQTTMSCS
jgi:hypothetical protein